MNKVKDSGTAAVDVMVVDDNQGNLELLVSILGGAGYNVRPASTGEMALRSLQAKLPALILLDVNLPDINGFEICRRIKADKRTSPIPVIFITIVDSDGEKIKGFQAGAVDYIIKPFNKEEVLARVHTHIGLRQAHLALEARDATLTQLNRKLESSTRLYAFLSEVNQAIVRIKEQGELFQTICRIAIEFGKFQMAWIGLKERESGLIKPIAHSGHEEGYLAMVLPHINNQSSAMALHQSVLLEGKVSICDDVEASLEMQPGHHEEALKRDYRSIAAVPVKLRGEVVGGLVLYAAEKGFFTAAEQRLLAEIGGDISFALDAFEAAKEHSVIEEKLASSEARYRRLFETAQDAILILDGDTMKIIDANPFIKDLLGYSHEDLLGKNLWEIGELKDTVASKVVNEVLRQNGYVRYEHLPMITRDRRQISVEVVANVYMVDKARVIQCNIRDMTKAHQAISLIREVNQDLEEAQRLTSIGSWKWEVATNKVTWSKSLCHINGWDPNLPPPPFEQMDRFYTPESWTLLGELAGRALNTGAPYEFEADQIRTDGTMIKTFSRGEAVYDDKGKIALLRGTVQDITERKKTEEILKMHSELLDMELDSVYLHDFEGNFLYVNKSAYTTHGYTREELLKMKLNELDDPESARLIAPRLQELMERGQATFEVNHRHKDGSLIPLEIHISIIELSGQKMVMSVARDITERKRTEKDLKESEQRYRSLFEKASEGIVIADIETRKLKYVNPSICKMLGYTAEELIQRGLEDIHPEDSLEVVKANFEAQARGEKTLTPDIPCLKKDGTLIYMDISATKIIIDGKECNVGFFTDATERRRAEEERQKADRLDSIGTLAGGIAHDFNNILTAILGNIQLAEGYLGKGKTDTALEMLADAEKASMRARSLTQQLLTFSRGGAPVRKVMQIGEFLKETAIFTLRGTGCKPEFAMARDLWAAEVDEGQLGQVLSNLVINASQAMPNGGAIHICASNVVAGKHSALSLPEGRYVEIDVMDKGIGIPENNKGRIFEPYFTTKGKGSGLGLASSYSIIKNHGGIITFDSRLGEGTTFHVYLPATVEKVEEKTAKPAVTAQTAPSGRGRILVMDDEETIRMLLCRMLQGAGYEVELTGDGAEAIEKYTGARKSGKPYDVVILDLTVPGGMGGREVMARLLGIDPGVKGIVSSGYANDPIMADYKKYGFSGVVTKPYSLAQMQETLRHILIDKL